MENKISVPRGGMKKGIDPRNLTENDITHAINVTQKDGDGDYIDYSYEKSNVKAVVFPSGYKVIGKVVRMLNNSTYYFLTNPTTKNSLFGYVKDKEYDDSDLEHSLEEVEQQPYKEFVTLIDDSCSENKFNFSTLYPIHNVVLKEQKTGGVIYFTDYINPSRYIELDNIGKYFLREIPCDDDEELQCPDIDKMRIHKLYKLPAITDVKTVVGGTLNRGTYSFFISLSDSQGRELSEYTSLTLPTSIWDNTEEITNKAIRLTVNDLDEDYTHYKIVVKHNSHIDNSTNYYVAGVYPVTNKEVNITSIKLLDRISLEQLSTVNVKVTNSESVATFNNSLVEYGLVFERELNLQPVANMLGSYLQWQTHVAKEDYYMYPESSSKVGYNRNEVVPFSIRFLREGGSPTALMPLVSREALPSDRAIVNNRDTMSLDNSLNCEDYDRNERWMVYNTATVEGGCGTPEEFVEVEEVVNYSCRNNHVADSGPGSMVIGPDMGFTTVQEYIAEYGCVGEVCDVLEGDYSDLVECESPCNNNPQTISHENYISEEEGIRITDITTSGPSNAVVNSPEDYYGNKVSPVGTITYEDQPVTLYSWPNNTEMTFEKRVLVPLRGANPHNPAVLPEHLEANLPGSYFYIVPDTINSMELTVNSILETTYPNNNGGNTTVYYPRTDFSYNTSQGNHPMGLLGMSFFKNRVEEERSLKVVFNKMVVNEIPQEFLQIDDVLISIHIAKQPTSTENNYGYYSVPVYRTLSSQIGDKEIKLVPLENNQTKVVILSPEGEILEEHVSSVTPDSRDIYVTVTYPHIRAKETAEGGAADIKSYRTSPRGTLAVFLTKPEVVGKLVEFDNVKIGTVVNKRDTCIFLEPVVKDCETSAYKKGNFAYWESTSQYPDNPELFDSTTLIVSPEDIPEEYRKDFEQKFVIGMGPNGYKIKDSFNLTCQPIRHFKFPDNKIAPFMSTQGGTPFNEAYIYPLGVTIDENIINMFLDIALKNDLITDEERKQIYGYEIFRGDISIDRSVIASGLLYDTRTYNERGTDVRYLNYPYNSYSEDYLNKGASLPRGFGIRGHDYGFHSPETDYSNNVTASEVRIEGYQYGNSKGYFDEVEDHPKMVILASEAYNLASTIASTEVITEVAMGVGQLATNVGPLWFVGGMGSTGSNLGGYLAGMAAATLASGILAANSIIFNYPKYKLQWQETFRNIGQPVNFAQYYFSEGIYNLFKTEQSEGNMVRNLTFIKKIKDTRYSITDTIYRTKTELNNIDREYTTYLKVGEENYIEYPSSYSNYDRESLTYAGLENLKNSGRSAAVYKKIASPYAQIVNYLPNQYGTIDRISWLTTGYRGDLRNPKSECLPIFGGDTFITRHSLKRKMPLFLTTAMGQASLTPFSYKDYSNIGEDPRFYINYEVGGEFVRSGHRFPEVRSYFSLDEVVFRGKYYTKPSKFYLYYYGVPSFLTETRINTHYRESGREMGDNFYPNVGDLGSFTQEKNVSIRTPNFFKYTNTYSNQVIPFNSRLLNTGYSKKNSEIVSKSPNGVIFSLPDLDENSQHDPWLKFRALDFYEFDTRYGKLKELKGIENEAIMARFEHTAVIYNKVSTTVDDGSTPTGRLGGRDLFQRRTLSFVNSELGYGGTQQNESLSCEYGHFYTDTLRGQVLHIPTGGGSIHDISYSNSRGEHTFMSQWFKKNLPFKILNSGIEGIENLDVDNNYNGIGVTMAYDSNHKRILITKKDYIPVSDCQIYYERGEGFYTDNCEPPTITCPEGFEYDAVNNVCRKVTTVPLCTEGYTYDSVSNMCVPDSEEFVPSNYDGADIVFVFHRVSQEENAEQVFNTAKKAVLDSILTGDFNERFGSDIRYSVVKTNFLKAHKNKKFRILAPFTDTSGVSDALGNMQFDYNALDESIKYTTEGFYSPTDLAIKAVLDNSLEITSPNNSTVENSESVGAFRGGNIAKIIYVIGETNRGVGYKTTSTTYDDVYNENYILGTQEGVDMAHEIHQQAKNQDVDIVTFDVRDGNYPPTNPTEGNPKFDEKWFMQTIATTECSHHYYDFQALTLRTKILESLQWIGKKDCGPTRPIPVRCECNIVGTNCVCEEVVPPTQEINKVPISLYDERYFKEVSWTISYNPESGSFDSYMDYTPNYYVNHYDYFESGINHTESSLWSHGVTNKSYGVFYGEYYPKEVEILVKNSLKEYIGNVELITEAKRYYDNDDFRILPDETYNESIIYNRKECSGRLSLELVKGRLGQYPITHADYQVIPITKTENTFNYNYFFDRVKDPNMPFIRNDENQIRFELDNVEFKQRKPLARINGDYFKNRLIYNKGSKYNITLKLHKGLINRDNL